MCALSGSLDMSWEELGKQILSLFHVDPLSGVSLDMSWEELGKQILPLFHVDQFVVILCGSAEAVDKMSCRSSIFWYWPQKSTK